MLLPLLPPPDLPFLFFCVFAFRQVKLPMFNKSSFAFPLHYFVTSVHTQTVYLYAMKGFLGLSNIKSSQGSSQVDAVQHYKSSSEKRKKKKKGQVKCIIVFISYFSALILSHSAGILLHILDTMFLRALLSYTIVTSSQVSSQLSVGVGVGVLNNFSIPPLLVSVSYI
jgi:hypothetical protein